MAIATPLDLDAYLERIKYTGSRKPTFDALTGILQAHIASIPFESFDVLLGRPIRLDPEGLQNKMITARRGGYCFEHASLMYPLSMRSALLPLDTHLVSSCSSRATKACDSTCLSPSQSAAQPM
jgi:N-hydroxyarylamine O-acetyltransferase